ncbi:MAG: Asp-tRNA(Asn)/Glu-tRNA(Gln) amidotransferase subunit GatC [Leadbetterella sp.]
MKITPETIQKMAHLSRIEVKQEEEATLMGEFQQILDWMEQLNELDTNEIEPLYHMHNNVNLYREDLAKQEITREEALLNAPQKNEEYFMVPKVIE